MEPSIDELMDMMFGDYSYQFARMFPDKTDEEIIDFIQKIDKDVLKEIWTKHLDRFTDGELQYIQNVRESIILQAYNESLSCVYSESAKYFDFLDSDGTSEVKN